jgi:hypothetical protein
MNHYVKKQGKVWWDRVQSHVYEKEGPRMYVIPRKI